MKLNYRVKSNGHQLITGRTANDVVKQLAKLPMTPDSSLQTYMKEVSARVWAQKQLAVRVDTPQHFLDDLIKADVIEKVSI